MNSKTHNFLKINNEHIKNFVVFVAIIIASFVAIIASGIFAGSVNLLWFSVFIALANAFWQEVAFRGFLQKRLIKTYGILPGILLTSFSYCLHHCFQGKTFSFFI